MSPVLPARSSTHAAGWQLGGCGPMCATTNLLVAPLRRPRCSSTRPIAVARIPSGISPDIPGSRGHPVHHSGPVRFATPGPSIRRRSPAWCLEAGINIATKIAAYGPLGIKTTLVSAHLAIDAAQAEAMSKLNAQYRALYETSRKAARQRRKAVCRSMRESDRHIRICGRAPSFSL
jgi:hypothetical protein